MPYLGTSIAMIDLHYGHLAVDSHEHAVSRRGHCP
jgi:hypothetical protein